MGKKGGLFRYADGVDKLLMFLGTLGCIGDGLMTPLNMFILSALIDDYGGAADDDASLTNDIVDKYSLRLLCVAIGVGISACIGGICWTRSAERQTSRIRIEYLKSVLRQEVSFFDNQNASSTSFQVVSAISADAHSIQDAIAEKIPNCVAHLSTFIFGLILAFYLSWRLALASVPFSLGFVIPGVAFGKLLMSQGMKMKDAYGVAGSVAEQVISSIRTVYSYVGENETVKRFSNSLEESFSLGVKQGLTKGLLLGSMGMIYVSWAFQSWAGSVLVANRGESGGRVFISALCVVLGGLSCMSALPNISFITEATIAAARIFELIDRVPQIDSEDGKGKVLAYVRGDIDFNEVTFSYPSRPDIQVLQDFNLKVKAGRTVAIVGGSGSGKSTVISLLERFYDPINGDILLDGRKIKKLQLKWLRSQTGLVNQEPVLFATSIKENILFGKEGASMEMVVEAAKAANAHDFATSLPDGYDTHVGQFGFQLSGGQKQRIAIARALIKDPKILLLDEATSALDAQSERIVQEALDQASQGRTTIIVAHRLSTIRRADKIVVLESGRIVESGSHDDLMSKTDEEGGVYFKMVKLQQSTANGEGACSPYLPKETRGYTRRNYNMPMSPYSPASPFSPAISVSYAPSIHTCSYYDSDNEYLETFSHPSPSTWRLLQMNAPEWKIALLGCLGAITFGVLQPLYAFCLGSVVSAYTSNDIPKIKSEIKIYSIVFLSIGLTSFIANLLQHYNFAKMGETLTKRVREQVLSNLLTFEVGWFDQDQNTSAAVCARLSTEARMVRSLVGDRMSLLIQVSASASVAFVLALIVAWRVAIVLISIQPLLIASFYSRSVLMKRMSERSHNAQSEGSQLASEAVINHRTITAFSSQNRMLDLFAKTQKGPRKENIRQSLLSGAGLFCSQFLTTAAIALTYWYGGRLMNKNLLSSKHLFQVFFLLMSTGKNIADTGSMTSDLARGSSAVASVFAILDRKTEIEPENPEGLKITKVLKGKIELKNVFFNYPSRPDQAIFQGVNLKIEAGKTVALVGQSGSGKSTMIGLIERFYDPIKGQVLIDDKDIKSYNLKSLRSQIALVSQEPILFAGSISDNIIYGKEEATESEIKKAAIRANAHEFISAMKDGYETYCGERGVQLSGGQRQRIALARAILKNPTILLLDEATSALDSISENLVQEALERMMISRTSVAVAHRLSTIQKADTIAMIKNGKVVEQGSHSQLLALGKNGSYYGLMKLQSGHSPYR
ncbi:putative multidrug resistance protein [Lycium barbarum]|uniref:putative multidrug resistance protein n=1 Tax=Lycium barbarum TaxID=112863 RepID=UPI00293F4774|nr:putative multidrug resistance protein [Lycium barbarum]